MLSDSNPDFLRPVSSDEFLPPISRWTTLGGLFLVGTFGVAVMLAAYTQYNITVKAAAVVRPIGELRIVQAATEGTIKSISVKENQVVKQGDAIAILDNSQLQTKKSQLQGNIQNNQQQLSQIAAQISALDSQQKAEWNLMNRNIASAQADLGRNQRDYQEKQITTKAEVQEAQASVDLARVQMNQYQQLANTGAIAQLQIKEKEEAFKAAQARLQRAKAMLNPSAAPVVIANERIAQERATGESTLATLNKERKTLIQRQIEIQNQLNSDTRELKQIGMELQKSVIRAPASGTILKLELRNASQVVRAAEPIAQIAPSNTPLIVKARVAAQDIGKVAVGQKVQMRVSAYPYPDYGTLSGKVSAIAPDAIAPENNNANAPAVPPSYEVTIQPEKINLIKGDRPYPIQPGMEIAAEIISREETVLTFILRKARLLTDL
ncbi:MULTISPECIES: HlyD family efflux transporter periplasmic adaptor subunit [unclassified Coleofasciculus]|uniref:HlyD family secretion protein n=1 Tax=Cyanophyceae TaxID=3028117 RepID=UPI0016845DA3|nr:MULTISPECIES: HlyD family efflux transporter periplasmic adaptor subunit [unclassified Coleofasciculus]MBD1895489.1 HlyD family efflux transporter periplasmic adaptor subunit [Coleofasciculus sp. FACHB-129]MBD2541640.1 HlyD family efflux transporter periplasmic adaptor subunit [Coleofasciculus sp. FACHB-SPT36]